MVYPQDPNDDNGKITRGYTRDRNSMLYVYGNGTNSNHYGFMDDGS